MSMKDPFLKSTAKSRSWQNGVNYVGKISNMKFNRVMSQSYVLGSRGISHNRRDLDAVEKHRAVVSI